MLSEETIFSFRKPSLTRRGKNNHVSFRKPTQIMEENRLVFFGNINMIAAEIQNDPLLGDGKLTVNADPGALDCG